MRGSRTALAAALSASVACAALALHADADEPRVAIAWNAPTGCPSEAAVRDSLAVLLAGSSAPVDARAEVRRAGERWQVVVVMNGGERRLEADSCRALADATALIVAMAVNPARVAANRSARDASAASGSLPAELPVLADASTDAPPSPDAAPTPTPTPTSTSTSTSTPTPTPTPTSTPTPTPPPALVPPLQPASPSPPPPSSTSVRCRPPPSALPSPWDETPWPLRLDLSASYFPSSTTSIQAAGAPTSSTARFSLVAAAIRACYLARPTPFELGPCLGAEAGLLLGSSQGISTIGSGSSPLFAVNAGLLAAWHFAPAWALLARADGLLQTYRPTFQVNAGQPDAATLHTPGLVTGRGSLGLEVRF